MKQASKIETDISALINQISSQIKALESKLDTLINRSSTQPSKPLPAPHQPKERQMHKIICADCSKEASLPFKPTGDRPVYCQDCFSKRRMISMSRIGINKPQEEVISPEPKVNTKKKAITVKKPVSKKKPVPKKK